MSFDARRTENYKPEAIMYVNQLISELNANNRIRYYNSDTRDNYVLTVTINMLTFITFCSIISERGTLNG